MEFLCLGELVQRLLGSLLIDIAKGDDVFTQAGVDSDYFWPPRR
jgi:hypothetical protein